MTGSFVQRPTIKALLIFTAISLVSVCIALLSKPVLVPMIISWVLYILLDPACSALVRRDVPRTVAIILVLLFVMIVVRSTLFMEQEA